MDAGGKRPGNARQRIHGDCIRAALDVADEYGREVGLFRQFFLTQTHPPPNLSKTLSKNTTMLWDGHAAVPNQNDKNPSINYTLI